uniref:PH domain-containing protein n=1 Tax=Alexandrium monilatum TaxID=311494 RepID=A0A7S4RJF1_9DINO
MFAKRFCRCFCSSGEQSDIRAAPEIDCSGPDSAVFKRADTVELVKPIGALGPPDPSKVAIPLSYSTAPQPLRGVPIREDSVWLLTVEHDCVEEITKIAMALYINGISFTYKDKERSFSLSPFTLVRPCRFYDDQRGIDVSALKCFKVALFAAGALLYFAVGERGVEEKKAEEERQRWAVDISCAVQLVTQSLFPSYSISCDPLEAATQTQRRLMAGYLIVGPSPHAAVLLFCELQPQSKGQARLALYESEGCAAVVMNIFITENSTCVEKVGLNCSCFSVGDTLFAARTPEERRLWLRVISNVKAKLRNRAPSPTDLELRHYRSAIKEHLHRAEAGVSGHVDQEPLLVRADRQRAPAHLAMSPPPTQPITASPALAQPPAPPAPEAPAPASPPM